VRYKLASCSCVWKWSGLLGRCALALWFGLALRTASARAEEGPRQLSVLHAAVVGVDPAAVARVDRALQDTLATQRRQSSVVQTSPVPFEDVQLIAGCGADETACLQLIANQLGSDALLVRRLVAQPDRRALVTLTAYATQPGATPTPPREVSALIDWTEAQGAEHAVQHLMAQLYPAPPEPVQDVPPPVVAPVVEAPTEPMPEQQAAPPTSEDLGSSSRSRWPSRLGWSVAAVGCGLLVAGIVSGAASRRDERAYARAPIVDGPSVDRAHSLLDDADHHARLANGLIIGGAVVSTAGLATVLWRWAADRSETPRSETNNHSLRAHVDQAAGATSHVRRTAGGSTALRLHPSLQPIGSGLMLSLHGSWQGGS